MGSISSVHIKKTQVFRSLRYLSFMNNKIFWLLFCSNTYLFVIVCHVLKLCSQFSNFRLFKLKHGRNSQRYKTPKHAVKISLGAIFHCVCVKRWFKIREIRGKMEHRRRLIFMLEQHNCNYLFEWFHTATLVKF